MARPHTPQATLEESRSTSTSASATLVTTTDEEAVFQKVMKECGSWGIPPEVMEGQREWFLRSARSMQPLAGGALVRTLEAVVRDTIWPVIAEGCDQTKEVLGTVLPIGLPSGLESGGVTEEIVGFREELNELERIERVVRSRLALTKGWVRHALSPLAQITLTEMVHNGPKPVDHARLVVHAAGGDDASQEVLRSVFPQPGCLDRLQAEDVVQFFCDMYRLSLDHLLQHCRDIAGSAASAQVLRELRSSLAHSFGRAIREWRYQVAVVGPDELPVPHASFVRELLEELVFNAFKVFKQQGVGGVVQIAASSTPPDWIAIKVSDDGPGPPEGKEPEQLFEPGYSGTREQGGTGFGLSQFREDVHALGGTLTAGRNGGGPGMTFALHLPATAQGNRS